MCGIAGVFDTKEHSHIDQSTVGAMADAIAHRGPDGDGFFFYPGVGLGHRRLAIIDVAGGKQPLFNENGTIALTYNGELYNYLELIPVLKAAGHTFSTHSDSEVIIHAWEEWGERCLERFRGMFAFAIHDQAKQCLFLARDRLGEKPLYYSLLGDGKFIFGSELKALLTYPGIARQIDPVAMDQYLAFGYVPDPLTIYKNIKKLPPAHYLKVARNNVVPTPKRYWDISFADRPLDKEETVRELRTRLAEAVRIQLMSEVPLGAFLSGGVDSSAVVAMMSDMVPEPVETFALGFGPGGPNELTHARRVADRYGTQHHEVSIDIDPLGSFRTQAAIFDEPFADQSAIPTYHISAATRQHVTVALSGDAGDELFAGYRRYRMFKAVERWRTMFPDAPRHALFSSVAKLYPKLDWAPRWLRAKYTLQEIAVNSAEGYYRSVCRIHDEMRKRLYSEDMRVQVDETQPSRIISEAMERAGTDDPVAKAQFVDLTTYLPGDILTKVDRASMASSLEVRVPMLDHEFVTRAAQIQTELKIAQGEGKYILKKALEPYVPRENLYRSKQGFSSSLASHFRSAGPKAVKALLLSEQFRDSGFFDTARVAKLVDEHMTGYIDHSRALWTLLMFEGFLTQVHFGGGERTSVKKSVPVPASAVS